MVYLVSIRFYFIHSIHYENITQTADMAMCKFKINMFGTCIKIYISCNQYILISSQKGQYKQQCML